MLNGPARPGDNLCTYSIIALNPDTGKLAWGFQASPHDTHDWDAAEVPVLVDGNFEAQPTKMLMQASRNGYFFVLDRATGQEPVDEAVRAVNWAKGIDKERPADSGSRQGTVARRACSSRQTRPALTNYRSPSFDPREGLLLVSAQEATASTSSSRSTAITGGRAPITASADESAPGHRLPDRQDRWSHDIGDGAAGGRRPHHRDGVPSPATTAGNALALRTSDGATLWHSGIGRVGTAPVTYELDGRQYLLIGGGSSLFAFALPR